MTTTVAIEQLTLQNLEERFGLQRSADPEFFREWRDRLPELGRSRAIGCNESKPAMRT
ncbi:MAG: hypothetical protein ACAF42_11345 [Limnothrix sp. BL-A-16]